MAKVFRFSTLSGDFDLDDMVQKKQPPKSKPVRDENIFEFNHNVTLKDKQKKKKHHEKDSLQSLAFGHEKPKKKGGATNGTSSAKVNGGPAPAIKKNKTNGVASNGVPSKKEKAVTDDWKIRDQKFVAEENERELREAMLLSKLDFEAKKQKKQKEDAVTVKTKKKQKEKPITISLNDFNAMDSKKVSSSARNDTERAKKGSRVASVTDVKDDNFFMEVEQAVKTQLQKESRQKQYADNVSKDKKSNKQEASSRSGAPVLVSISEVEKRDFEIQALRLEVVNLKDQLEKVKLRNKKLCEVLGTAEMRSMGEVVIELDKVSKARDEFSAEVATLSEQLEQEKTKVSQLQDKHRKK